MMPVYIPWLIFKIVAFMREERNGFKTDEVCKRLSAHKVAEFIPDINIADVKKCAQVLTSEKQKFTINDVLMTVMSKSMHDYLRQHTSD